MVCYRRCVSTQSTHSLNPSIILCYIHFDGKVKTSSSKGRRHSNNTAISSWPFFSVQADVYVLLFGYGYKTELTVMLVVVLKQKKDIMYFYYVSKDGRKELECKGREENIGSKERTLIITWTLSFSTSSLTLVSFQSTLHTLYIYYRCRLSSGSPPPLHSTRTPELNQKTKRYQQCSTKRKSKCCKSCNNNICMPCSKKQKSFHITDFDKGIHPLTLVFSLSLQYHIPLNVVIFCSKVYTEFWRWMRNNLFLSMLDMSF